MLYMAQFAFLKNIYLVSLFREREKEWAAFYSLLCSTVVTTARSGPSQSQELETHPDLPHDCRSQVLGQIFWCLCRFIDRKMEQNQSSWDSSWHSDMGCWPCKWMFSPLHRTPPPQITFQNCIFRCDDQYKQNITIESTTSPDWEAFSNGFHSLIKISSLRYKHKISME